MNDKLKKPVDAGTTTIDQLTAGGNVSVEDTFIVMQGVTGARKTKKVTGQQIKDFAKTDYTLPVATNDTLGGIKVGAGLSVKGDGTVSADAQPLAPATTKTLGGVIVGKNLTVKPDGTLDADVALIPPATKDKLGGIKVGANLSVTDDGTLSAVGGGADRPFYMLSANVSQWSPDPKDKFSVVVANSAVDLSIVVNAGAYSVGTEVEIYGYTGNVVQVVSGENVVINTEGGTKLPANGTARLIFVGTDKNGFDIWLFRGERLTYGAPFINSVQPSGGKGAYSPLTAQVSTNNSAVWSSIDTVNYYARKSGTQDAPTKLVVKRPSYNVGNFYNLSGWTDYDFWATYTLPDGKESGSSNVVKYRVQGDVPDVPECSVAGSRGILTLFNISCGGATFNKVEVNAKTKGVDSWVQCEIDSYTGLWSFNLGLSADYSVAGNVFVRASNSHGTGGVGKFIVDFPQNLTTQNFRVYQKNDDCFLTAEWDAPKPAPVNADTCFYNFHFREYDKTGKLLTSTEGNATWDMTSYRYLPANSHVDGLLVEVDVNSYCYTYRGLLTTKSSDYQPQPRDPFEFISCESNYDLGWIRVKCKGMDPRTDNLHGELSKNIDFTSAFILTGGTVGEDGMYYVYARSVVPDQYYFRVKRWREGKGLDTDFEPSPPILINYGV